MPVVVFNNHNPYKEPVERSAYGTPSSDTPVSKPFGRIVQNWWFIGKSPLSLSTPNTQTQHPNHLKLHHPLFRLIALLSLLLVGLLVTTEVKAQWSRDPAEAINVGGPIWAIKLVTDSIGGAFVVAAGHDNRTYCYYVDPDGFPKWNKWVDVSPVANLCSPPRQAFCSEKGYAVVLNYSEWHSVDGDTSWDIRAQKINTQGEFMWQDSGISVSNMRLRFPDDAYFEIFGIESDGEGGIIVAWSVLYYTRNMWNEPIFKSQSMFVQRISADGELIWDEGGVEILQRDTACTHSKIVTDKEGGIVLLYYAGRLEAQRLAHDGRKLWGNAGIRYELISAPKYAISDGLGGTILTDLIGFSEGRRKVRVFRLSADGQQLWEGTIVKDVDYRLGQYLDESFIVQASDSIFFVNWNGDTDEEPHPLVQAVNLQGELIWDRPGSVISTSDSIQFGMLGTVSDDAAIYSWLDRRDISGQTSSVCAQRMDIYGNRLWGKDDVLLFNRRATGVTDVISDMNGGAIFFLGYSNLQQVNRNGELGIPLSVRSYDQPLAEGIDSFTLFPNPANSTLSISLPFLQLKPMPYSIQDILGRSVSDGVVTGGRGAVSLIGIPSGYYLLTVGDGVGRQTVGFTVQK